MATRVYVSGNSLKVIPVGKTYQFSGAKAFSELVERKQGSGTFSLLYHGVPDSHIGAVSIDDVELSDGSGGWVPATRETLETLADTLGFNVQADTGDGGGVRVDTAFNVFPPVGEEGLIYVAEDTGQMYLWTGTEYEAVGGGSIAAPTVKTLYESNADTEEFNTASKNKVDLITVTEAIDLDSVVEAGSGTITSPNTGNGNSGNAPGHTMTASIKGLWFMIDDDGSGLEVDMFNGDLVNNYPAAGTYALQIAFRGYEHTSLTQTLTLTIT